MTTARHAFSVSEGQVSIFPTDANGDAVIETPIYLGAVFQNLSIVNELEVIEDRPSGVIYPERHHGAEMHSFEFEKLWEVELPLVNPPSGVLPVIVADPTEEPVSNGRDFKLQPNVNYVFVFVWKDEKDPNRFHHRTYYGVTDRSHNISGSSAEGEHLSKLKFDAQYFL